MRSRLTYANVVATLALFLAMSGGALAAKHYLINSTKQINPKVLKTLHGARGAIGERGPTGAQGVEGKQGRTGPRGEVGRTGANGFSALSTLPTDEAESGEVELSGTSTEAGAPLSGAASFPVPLAAEVPADQVVVLGPGATSADCEGPGKAARGWLCVYLQGSHDVAIPEKGAVYDPEKQELEEKPIEGSGLYGFGLRLETGTAGTPPSAYGSYTVKGN